MPDGIYLNARELGIVKLGEKINELIKSPDKYAEYFRWKKHYSFHKTSESVQTNEYCRFCSILNNEDKVKKVTGYNDFVKWWGNHGHC